MGVILFYIKVLIPKKYNRLSLPWLFNNLQCVLIEKGSDQLIVYRRLDRCVYCVTISWSEPFSRLTLYVSS